MHLKDLMGHNDFNTTLGYFKIREEKITRRAISPRWSYTAHHPRRPTVVAAGVS